MKSFKLKLWPPILFILSKVIVKDLRIIFGFSFFALLLVSFTGCSVIPESIQTSSTQQVQTTVSDWIPIHPGLSWIEIYPKISTDVQKNILLMKIDPKIFHFSVFQNNDKEKALSIRQIYEQEKAVAAFNGTFFGEDFKPVGFLKDGKNVFHKISNADLLNGVFTLFQNGEGKLFASEQFIDSEKTVLALQNGPILIDQEGKIQVRSDTGKLASRTAIGFDKDGNVILIFVKQSLFDADNIMTLYKFAYLLKEDSFLADLRLHGVLNLDGGPSTGMMIGDHYYPEVNKVQNIIVVK